MITKAWPLHSEDKSASEKNQYYQDPTTRDQKMTIGSSDKTL
jgi:hypothetical protein